MGASALPVEQLRQYLRGLPTGARALLITELERALLRGEEIPGGAMLLQEVRVVVREAGDRVRRIGSPVRLFFSPVEPFLINACPIRKTKGRIPRTALEPIWNWIARDLLPDEAKAYVADAAQLLASNETEAANALAFAFQDQVIEPMGAAIGAADADEKAWRRLSAHVGITNAVDDVRDVRVILEFRDALALIADRLPGHVRNFADGDLESIKALLDSPVAAQPGLRPYALILAFGRLAVPWQLIRLGAKAADSDGASRIASSSYAAAVTIVLDDIECMVEDLRADLNRGATVAVSSLLKCIHDASRGLRTELDLPADSPWGRQLAATRSGISDLLRTHIESVPGRVRHVLRPRTSSEIARESVLAPDEVAETEVLLEFVNACRNYAGELAISEMTLRTCQQIQQYLDTGTRALLDALRGAGESDRPFRRSQVDAAVRFCAKVFGQDYASLLAKAAETADNAERRAAAAKA